MQFPTRDPNMTAHPLPAGKVWLIGAGPGDPELLTLKAARLIAAADALVYDHLVSDAIVALASPAARRIYVGKEASNHTLPQDAINTLLVDLAREGLAVVRLKGGDPFIFGRGGEELETLAGTEIPFEVVPGVTAASGCAAYSGFPLTHRDHAQAVTFVTGHLKDGTVNLDWPALARPCQTVVFYMGIGAAGEICRQMIAHGLPAATPAAVVRNGTQPDQRTLLADLATLPARIAESGIKPPALIIVGSVVSLHERLSWFEKS
jgi:uroporphyrin-III C-methyltransferase